MSRITPLRLLERDVEKLLDTVDHIITKHDPHGPCFEELKNAALIARQSLVLFMQRN